MLQIWADQQETIWNTLTNPTFHFWTLMIFHFHFLRCIKINTFPDSSTYNHRIITVGKDLQDDLVHPSVHPHHAQCPCPSVTHPHGSWTPLPPPWNTVFLTNTVLGWHMCLLWNIQDRWSKTQDTKQLVESKAYCPHHHTTWFVSLYDILRNPRAHISVKLLRQPMLLNFEEVQAEHQLQGLVRIQKKKQIQL